MKKRSPNFGTKKKIKISNFVGESVPVVDGDRTLKGVVTESDLFIEYLKVQDKISEIEKD